MTDSLGIFRSRSPLKRTAMNLSEAVGLSATPLRGPYRFMPVLAGQEIFKVAVGNVSRQNEDSRAIDSVDASKVDGTTSSNDLREPESEPPKRLISNNSLQSFTRPGEPEPKPPKFLTKWAPRLIGKKLFVEGNLLQEK